MTNQHTATSPAYDIEAAMHAMRVGSAPVYKINCASHDDAVKLRQRMNHIRRMDRRKGLRAQQADGLAAKDIIEQSLFDKMVFEIPPRAAYVLVHVENGPGLLNQITIPSRDGSPDKPFHAPDTGAVDMPAYGLHDTSERDFDL